MIETKREVDVAIIGAGSAGLVARRQALANGAKRVLLIEGGPYGTTCARVGCMPSKLLIAAAEAAHGAQKAGVFGVEAEVRVDGEAVMARVRRERDHFAGGVVESTEALPEDQKLRGWARFVGPKSLVVEGLDGEGETHVDAEVIVIAAGSAPWVPPPLRDLGDRLLSNENIFELATIPRSLAVVGTGVIGLELGQAMARLGARTRVFDVATRMPLVKSEPMQAEVRRCFEARLDLDLGVEDIAGERIELEGGGAGVRLSWTDAEGNAHSDEFEYVLAATGRRPQLERLQLAEAGIELDDRGAPLGLDERTGQIGEHPIFMAGDVTGTRPLLHEAAAEGRIAGINAGRWPDVRAQPRYVSLGVLFCDPQVAVVGEIPEEGEGEWWEAGEVSFGNQGRARVMAKNCGRARIYASHKCGTLIAAELVGPQVEHLAHLLAWAIEEKVTAQRALALPYYHPVLEEGLRTAIQRLARKLKLVAKPHALDCGPGV
ncbi:dihydrolipoyl dehydrogenase [Pseudenhygromyxa sp. WMMC2535]|uniref:dihydrolipoyl dehydrogenase n=1 Tax=Pseudenhygromyxa sp. WMMC2535 TaxID=2712867 RepID=UPI0015548023|nr:dihydrolipoyl dehydrogenase [Pseudenhygromyxa sp. WMMC2535]NVB37277.1 dihydrolipoyl dehydrogenase [Pseudenhygromyxa sp. WMMC2535]NVB43609.1 dihydrolipoyl dehydrogenase [Pseudenhygromyxa sp. WMMC2535]